MESERAKEREQEQPEKKSVLTRFMRRDRNQDQVINWREFSDDLFKEEPYVEQIEREGLSLFTSEETSFVRAKDPNHLTLFEYREMAPARAFLTFDKNRDSVIVFDEMKGIYWGSTGPNEKRDAAHFSRNDSDGNGRVTWEEFKTTPKCEISFGALDHPQIDNKISRSEWNEAKAELSTWDEGYALRQQRSAGALLWFPGLFYLVRFEDLDRNSDGIIDWREFKISPRCR